MLNNILKISIIFSNLYFTHEPSSVFLSFDATNQFKYTLNEVNPYVQTDFKIGVFEINGLANLPYSKMNIDAESIKDRDSFETLTLFNFIRGDYSFRQTSILLKKYFDAKKSIILKGIGKKFPGRNNNFGSGYVLDNYLLDYVNENDFICIKLSNYYHKEDIRLPIINDDKTRFSEIFGFAVNIESLERTNRFGNNYKIFANYQNSFFNGNGYDYTLDEFQNENPVFVSSFLNKNSLNFGYTSHPNAKLSIYADFLINRTSSKYYENIFNNDLYSSKLKMRYFINQFFNFDVGLYKHNSDFGDFLEVFYKLKVKLAKSSFLKEINFLRNYDYDDINITRNLNYNVHYDMLNLLFSKNRINLNLSLYKIALRSKFDGALDEDGELINISIGYENKSSSIEFIIHEYLNYGPIDFNYSVVSSYIYGFPNKKYNFFSKLSYSFVMLNPEYTLIQENSGIWGKNSSNKVLSYPLSKLEFGIEFEDFVVSYNFLNRFDEVSFTEYGSNLDNPIYSLNYLNVKWQFYD
ncbi:MAG: hypothetical protein CMG59_04095 [Candidatus Marinimicrobia bacterium]|nr:hypothetical protein [Candidatus Neomarinimicrobiota bacterium]